MSYTMIRIFRRNYQYFNGFFYNILRQFHCNF
ncbi:hypothetical protein T4C_9294 [Trichinella pseudospiralis]|uniref:Uncharacterized protein n=1 Tax=Trichinella pseudospiralis TaxID=6337 RepID=A0A0V1GGW2_TRIPS|nr:hypothetical protein T4C_9294 [Trichinella pseudospiralis]